MTSAGMRILIVSPAFPPAASGEAEHCCQFAERLSSAGHQVTVLTTKQAAPPPARGFRVLATMKAWRWRQLPRLAGHLRELRPDAVLLVYTAWMFGHHPMITFLPTLLRWLLPDVRLVTMVEVCEHHRPRSASARAKRMVFRALAGGTRVDDTFGTLLRDSHAVVVLGPTVLSRLEAHEPDLRRRAIMIPPPPLLTPPSDVSPRARQQARADLGVRDETWLIAYFGHVYPGKGVTTLLSAMHILRRQGRPLRLVMAGGGRIAGAPIADDHNGRYESQMKAIAADLGLDDAVVWADGYGQDSDRAGRDLLAADLAVLPFDEGAELRRSSIAVVAAMGLPLVSTAPGVPEPAFVHGVNLLLCRPADAAALAGAIGRVIDDADLRERLRGGALALARDWFSWDSAVAKIVEAARGPQLPTEEGSGAQ